MNANSLSKGETLVLETLTGMGPAGSCQSIGDLKARMIKDVTGGLVNACLWALAERGLVNLFRHDYPAGMTKREKSRALQVNDKFYNGAAIRMGGTR